MRIRYEFGALLVAGVVIRVRWCTSVDDVCQTRRVVTPGDVAVPICRSVDTTRNCFAMKKFREIRRRDE